LGWKIRVVDRCDLGDNNRKADVSGQGSAPLKPSPKEPSEDEQKEYPDYYEDDSPRFQEIKKMDAASSPNNVDFGPELRTPGDSGDFFPENPFRGNFPTDFEDFFKESSFGSREDERPVPQRTTVPPRPSTSPRPTAPQRNTVRYPAPLPTAPPTPPTVKPTKPVPVPVRTTEPPQRQIPSQNVKTEEQKPHSGLSIPGPVKQLTKLIQHSTNFRQRPNSQNHQNQKESSPNHDLAEPRPLTPDRSRDRPQQPEKPAWSPSSNEQESTHFNNKETIPTRINPPPVQSHSFNQQSASSNLPFFRQQNDQIGGIFNPNTIILESGFKPIRNADGPIPPLGFDVEPQQNAQGKGISAEDPRFTTDSPSLVTLDPVFVASEQDHRRPKEPVPITLPKAVVPVVPGPSAPVPRFPPNHEANQQQVNHFNQQQFRPHPTPPAQRQQQQRPHFNGQDVNARPHTPPPSPPARKKSSGLAAFFSFGGNRRKEQNTPPLATPIAAGPSGPSPNNR
jgi:hypothetical protein